MIRTAVVASWAVALFLIGTAAATHFINTQCHTFVYGRWPEPVERWLVSSCSSLF